MEDTLWVMECVCTCGSNRVLILVLMEDTLWGMLRHNKLQDMISLNPCFNGRYSLSIIIDR